MKGALTAEQLRALLVYEPSTGVFTRTAQPRKGKPAGAIDSQGHVQIRVLGVLYAAHRLAWLYMTGAWPVSGIDHRDGQRANNSWTNLREATQAENAQNQVARRDNKSGLLGVCWAKRDRRWNAQIQTNGVKTNLGYFSSREQAHAAYLAAKARLHTFQPVPRDAATGATS